MKVAATDAPQNATEFLSPQQVPAIELLLGGLTVTAVAAELGVSPKFRLVKPRSS